jgi:hypothetical protein
MLDHIKIIDVIFLLGGHSIIIDIDAVYSWTSIQRETGYNTISHWIFRSCMFLFELEYGRINIRRNVVNL